MKLCIPQIFYVFVFVLGAISPANSEVVFNYIGSFGSPPSRAPGTMNYPSSVAVDGNTGDVFVMDKWFHRVQRFDANGIPIQQWRCQDGHGIEVDSLNDFVYVAITTQNKVRKYTFDGILIDEWSGDVTPQGSFSKPQDVAIHPITGDVYILDSNNAKVQILNKDGDYVGGWSGSWASPFGIAAHPVNGNIYIAETAGYMVHAYTDVGTPLNSWGARGSLPGQMAWPRGLAVAPDGSVYVADTDNDRIQKFTPDGEVIAIIQGPMDSEHGAFHVRDVAINPTDGKLYAAAAYQQRIDKFSADDKFELTFGMIEKEGEYLNQPKGISIDPNTGDIYVADMGNQIVKRFTSEGIFVGYIGDPAVGLSRNEYGLTFATSIKVDDESHLWVLFNGVWYPDMPHWGSSMYVRRFKSDNKFSSGFTDTGLNSGMGGIEVVSGSNDIESIYVSSTKRHEIVHYTPWGKNLGTIGNGILSKPEGLIHDPWDSSLIVIDSGDSRIKRFDPSGALVDSWGSFGSGQSQFKFIIANNAAIDRFGNIYVADGGNHRIQAFDWAGAYMGELSGNITGTSARFRWPAAVAINGNVLYVVDTGGGQIDMFSIE